jgi:hypothetical protein
MIKSGNELGSELVEFIGLPKNCIWFELRCHIDETVTIKCEYYPKIEKEPTKKIFAKYKLIKDENS